MAVLFQQKCSVCRKNWVTVSWKTRFARCYDCEKEHLRGAIADPEMKALFSLPEEFYRKNAFLRSIKINYLRYKNLTAKQLDAFKKAVQKMQQEQNQSEHSKAKSNP